MPVCVNVAVIMASEEDLKKPEFGKQLFEALRALKRDEVFGFDASVYGYNKTTPFSENSHILYASDIKAWCSKKDGMGKNATGSKQILFFVHLEKMMEAGCNFEEGMLSEEMMHIGEGVLRAMQGFDMLKNVRYASRQKNVVLWAVLPPDSSYRFEIVSGALPRILGVDDVTIYLEGAPGHYETSKPDPDYPSAAKYTRIRWPENGSHMPEEFPEGRLPLYAAKPIYPPHPAG